MSKLQKNVHNKKIHGHLWKLLMLSHLWTNAAISLIFDLNFFKSYKLSHQLSDPSLRRAITITDSNQLNGSQILFLWYRKVIKNHKLSEPRRDAHKSTFYKFVKKCDPWTKPLEEPVCHSKNEAKTKSLRFEHTQTKCRWMARYTCLWFDKQLHVNIYFTSSY